jgi:tellurite resistance protein TehA-like permease
MEKKSIKRLSKSINQGVNTRGGNHDVGNQEADDMSSTQSFDSSSSSSSSSSEDYYHKGYNEAYILRKAHKRALRYEAERNSLIEQWKAEYRAEAEKAKALEEYSKWYNRLYRWMSSSPFVQRVKIFVRFLTLVFSNLPSTIAGNALAITTLGIVWFKFAEENIDSCHPVHYHSHQCHYMEFPGCFYCDTSDPWYKIALRFHLICTSIGGALALCLVLKIILAWRVVLDELSSPTTSSPAGLMCMTLVCVFAVFGSSAKMIVLAAAFLHLCLVVWFNYMALAYRILPDPSWYPNTVGVGLSAVKTWLYYPWAGHFLMALSLGLNFAIFPISVIRVFVNEKISATVCWIQMSAPAVSLYALTIMAQPTFQEEQPDVSTFDRIHRAVYLPVMHIMFSLALIGVISAVHSLWVRWDVIRTKSFSPAHAAFPFPLLAHVNAIQAYRSAVDTFSTPSAFFQRMLYVYWLFMLLVGTVLTVVITGLFLYYLPRWTNVDVTDEVEPPAPNETVMAEIINKGFFEGFQQRFVSPAVLQANETGVLVRDASSGNYVRTRRIAALGFDPTMSWSEMNEARDTLLDWVSKNPPRHRHNTLSVPGISVQNFGRGNLGVYNDLEADFGLDHHPLGAGGSRNIHVSNRPRANSEKEMRRSHNMQL